MKVKSLAANDEKLPAPLEKLLMPIPCGPPPAERIYTLGADLEG